LIYITKEEKIKKSWIEKLNDTKDLPKVVKVRGKMIGKWGLKEEDTLAIPSPLEVNEIMKKVPKGKLITINLIREIIAKKHGAKLGCPITTGIFVKIVAFAAEEMREKGLKDITPYWRTLKGKGFLNEKFPGGSEAQSKKLQEEGFNIIRKGKNLKVENYEKFLFLIRI